MKKYEKEWPADDCDECGGDLVIRTDCDESDMVNDGDEAYCHVCGRVVGTISLDDEDDYGVCAAWLNLNDDCE